MEWRSLMVVLGLLAAMAAPARLLPAIPVAAQEATPCPATSPEENSATARRFFEDALNGRNLAVYDAILTPTIVFHTKTVPVLRGPDAVKQAYQGTLSAFPDVRYTVDPVVAQGDAVFLGWQADGTQTGAFRGIPATEATVHLSGIADMHFACGRIAEMWSEVDQLGRLRQLGALAAGETVATLTGTGRSAATPAAATPQTSCQATTPTANEATANIWWNEAWNEGDLDALDQVFSPTYQHAWAWGDDTDAVTQEKARIARLRTAFPDIATHVDEVIASGDFVAARWTATGTHQGDFFGA
ncbi:MAG TPA: ester cyclase family protein, partial [Thermomicrobiales bacterium]|nr:ester cyclase family protein [Thermomicrobiales bacterium]